MIGGAGGLALLIVAVIGVFYCENILARVLLAVLILGLLTLEAWLAFGMAGARQRFYFVLVVLSTIMMVVTVSKMKTDQRP